MSWISDIFKNLSRQMYPVSRAFKLPPGGTFDKLDTCLDKSNARVYNDSVSILDSIIPDNDRFTADDATQWEGRYGIITNASTPLADRKAAIIQKMAYPGTTAPRCAADYITDQLQLAGFNVKVYENRFFVGGNWVSKTPSEVLGIDVGDAGYGDFGYGELGYGDTISLSGATKIANSLSEESDRYFVVFPNYNSTFFIADPAGITTFATVLASRKTEFRQLILTLKPQQEVGFLFITYT